MNATRIKGVTLRHLHEVKHTPSDSTDLLVWPFVDMVLFGSLAAFFMIGSSSGSSLGFVMAGLLLYHVIFQTAVATSVTFMNETSSRNILNLVTTPVTTSEYAIGLIAYAMLRASVGVTVIVVLAKVLFDFWMFAHVEMVLIAATMVMVGIGTGLLLIALQVRLGRKAERFTWFLSALIPTLSGAFYPIEALPGAIQPVARALPTTHAFEAARAVVGGQRMPTSDVTIAATSGIALLVVGVIALGWSLRAFRRLGLVARYS